MKLGLMGSGFAWVCGVSAALFGSYQTAWAGCEEGQSAFEESTYDLMTSPGMCSSCHAGFGPGPSFAVEDVEESYLRVSAYVDFSDIPSSYFVERAGNGHCNCDMDEARMTASLQEWFDNGENQCPTEEGYVTKAVGLGLDLPGRDEGFQLFTWNLGDLQPDLQDVIVGVEVQQYIAPTPNAPGVYKINSPRIVSGDQTVRIAGIKVFLNGTFDAAADNFSSIDAVVSPQDATPLPNPNFPKPPYPLFSAASSLFTQQDAMGDALSLKFDTLSLAEEEACQALDEFQTKVLPVVEGRNCTFCHGGENQPGIHPANYRFFMDLDDEELCRAFRQRSRVTDGVESVVFAYASGAFQAHPRIFTDTELQEVKEQWSEWISAEFQ